MSQGHRRAIVLWSGGLDSTTVLSIAREQGFQPFALIFRYGQRHAVEVEMATALASELGVEYRIVELDLTAIGGSALTTADIEVPLDRPSATIATGAIPPTYVPARNTIFLAYGLAWAEVLGASDVFIGVNALDYSGYPDCRPEYVEAFERMAYLACRATTEGGQAISIRTPLIRKTKVEIIQLGVSLGVDYSRTWSCYNPRPSETGGVVSCGRCDSCLLRRKGFRDAGVPDPTRYENASARSD